MPLAVLLLAGAWLAHSAARSIEAVTDDPDHNPTLPLVLPALAAGFALAWWLAPR